MPVSLNGALLHMQWFKHANTEVVEACTAAVKVLAVR